MGLKQIHKDWIVDTFFLSSDIERRFAGARSIATKLVESGECIIAGDNRIWRGGIGNFIKDKPAENAIDCTKLTFDVEAFASKDNLYFMDYYESANHVLENERDKAIETCKSFKLFD